MTLSKKYTNRNRFITNYHAFRRAGLLVSFLPFDGKYYTLTVCNTNLFLIYS